MPQVSLFDQFSPTDFRYAVDALRLYLTEEAFIKYKSKVEAAIPYIFAKRGLVSREIADEIDQASQQVTAEEVYAEERKTGHDIIAQVNMIKKRVSDEAKPIVHRAATSYDIVDPANAMRYRDAFNNVVIPDVVGLEKVWIDVIRGEKDTLQIGRTHLQHAEPITFGFAMAWYAGRLGNQIIELKRAANSLPGKFSGAVGAYNASSLFVPSPLGFEEEILNYLKLLPGLVSTQVVQPEPVTNLMHHVVVSASVLANWADDMRNLMRPEIGEVWLPRGQDVSRSSTMPHKANPVGIENVKSQWKAIMPWMITMYMDLISDHQRDLTSSASQRYVPAILVQFDYDVRRAARISRDLRTNPDRMRRNFEMSKNVVTAEPLQLLLASLGYHEAHAHIGELADKAMETGRPVVELALEDPELRPFMERLTQDQMYVLSHPEAYTGLASKKAEEVASVLEEMLKEEKL